MRRIIMIQVNIPAEARSAKVGDRQNDGKEKREGEERTKRVDFPLDTTSCASFGLDELAGRLDTSLGSGEGGRGIPSRECRRSKSGSGGVLDLLRVVLRDDGLLLLLLFDFVLLFDQLARQLVLVESVDLALEGDATFAHTDDVVGGAKAEGDVVSDEDLQRRGVSSRRGGRRKWKIRLTTVRFWRRGLRRHLLKRWRAVCESTAARGSSRRTVCKAVSEKRVSDERKKAGKKTHLRTTIHRPRQRNTSLLTSRQRDPLLSNLRLIARIEQRQIRSKSACFDDLVVALTVEGRAEEDVLFDARVADPRELSGVGDSVVQAGVGVKGSADGRFVAANGAGKGGELCKKVSVSVWKE
jgi:hypothetical protein